MKTSWQKLYILSHKEQGFFTCCWKWICTKLLYPTHERYQIKMVSTKQNLFLGTKWCNFGTCVLEAAVTEHFVIQRKKIFNRVWKCTCVPTFWQAFQATLKEKCEISASLSLMKILFFSAVIFLGGEYHDTFDLILFLAKFFSYRCKMNKDIPVFASHWYDLRGWLGVKNQISIYPLIWAVYIIWSQDLRLKNIFHVHVAMKNICGRIVLLITW